jgi:hypothetical protein
MFKFRKAAAAATTLLSALVFSGLATQAIASRDENKVETKQSLDNNAAVINERSNELTARFAQMPLSSRIITIVAESARVVVKRMPGLNEIIVSSNCPRNWSVQGALIRQAGFAGEIRKGSALLADDLGSRAIVNGHVYLFPPGGMKGLKLGADGVFVNGQLVEPLKGSDIPCNCSGEDYLELAVPQSFTGDLKIGSAGKSLISVESWKDGALECVMLGNSSLKAEKLEALPKAIFDNRGSGSADISEVNTRVFVANIKGQGNGSIRVKKGDAEMSNATIEGNGTIELHGKFKNLQQLVEGSGKIEVKP